jgi:hypothetical protein
MRAALPPLQPHAYPNWGDATGSMGYSPFVHKKSEFEVGGGEQAEAVGWWRTKSAGGEIKAVGWCDRACCMCLWWGAAHGMVWHVLTGSSLVQGWMHEALQSGSLPLHSASCCNDKHQPPSTCCPQVPEPVLLGEFWDQVYNSMPLTAEMWLGLKARGYAGGQRGRCTCAMQRVWLE